MDKRTKEFVHHQQKMLLFLSKYGGWQCLAEDRLTMDIARSLQLLGLITINEYNQAKRII